MHTPCCVLVLYLVDGAMTFGDFIELMSEVMVQTTRWGNLATKLEGYVGFDTVQEQIRKKNLKRGFELNLMVVGEYMYKQNNIPTVTSYTLHTGESGLGKSTLVNTLFKSKISRTACTPGPHPIPSTTEVNSVSHGECMGRSWQRERERESVRCILIFYSN